MVGLPSIEPPHTLIAGFTGFVSGVLVSFPVGPVNLTIINEGARRGFFWAFMISLGAVVMETIYCALAFMGFATFFTDITVKAAFELISFILMLYLGVKFLKAREIELHNRIEDRIEEKLHPHSAFMTGFVRVLGNPGVLLIWVTLTATLTAHDWVWPTMRDKLACIAGVCLGTGSWFLLLSLAVSRGYGRFNPVTLLRMSRISGALLLLAALVIGIRLVGLLESEAGEHLLHRTKTEVPAPATNAPPPAAHS